MATGAKRAKAYSYVRFSTPEQAKGHSYARQTEAAQAYARLHGLELDSELTFADLGVSAYKGRNAHTGALRAFLDAVQQGDIPEGSFLLVESLDRISRAEIMAAQGLFMLIIDAGINLVTLIDQRTYSRDSINQNPTDLIVSIVILMRGHEESATKARRVSAAYDKKRKDAAGKGPQLQPFSRMLPGWLRWDNDLRKHEVIKARVAVLRSIFRKADAGWSRHRIAHWLNELQVDTWGRAKRKASFWHSSYIQKLLRNPAVLGTFTPHKVSKDAAGGRTRKPLDAIEGYWPAVIDGDLFARVSAQARTTSARGRNAGIAPRSIVAGLLKCARCGSSAVRVSKGEQVYLVCSRANARAKGCKYQAVSYASVEEALRDNIEAIIEDTPRGLETAEIERAIRKQDLVVDDLRDEVEELLTLATRERSEAARGALREKELKLAEQWERLRELRTQQETLAKPNVQRRLSAVRAALTRKKINVIETNNVLKQAVQKIVMDPENGALMIHWHHVGEPTGPIHFWTRHFKPFDVVPGGYVYEPKPKRTRGPQHRVSGRRP
jgi:DNA invertase Pin-like site-specific DNA recombinase